MLMNISPLWNQSFIAHFKIYLSIVSVFPSCFPRFFPAVLNKRRSGSYDRFCCSISIGARISTEFVSFSAPDQGQLRRLSKARPKYPSQGKIIEIYVGSLIVHSKTWAGGCILLIKWGTCNHVLACNEWLIGFSWSDPILRTCRPSLVLLRSIYTAKIALCVFKILNPPTIALSIFFANGLASSFLDFLESRKASNQLQSFTKKSLTRIKMDNMPPQWLRYCRHKDALPRPPSLFSLLPLPIWQSHHQANQASRLDIWTWPFYLHYTDPRLVRV